MRSIPAIIWLEQGKYLIHSRIQDRSKPLPKPDTKQQGSLTTDCRVMKHMVASDGIEPVRDLGH